MILGAALAGMPAVTSAAAESNCYDAAVVAAINGYTFLPLPPAGPNEIVLSGPVRLQLDVEQVVFGPLREGQLSVTMVLHTRLNQNIQHVLFLLKRRPNGWGVEHIEPFVIPDHRGRFVVPMAESQTIEYLAPNGWIPVDYERWLRPIRYDPREIWWLAEPHLHADQLTAPADGWSRPAGHRRIVLRGLLVDEMPKWLARCR
jgi:hypothetical protein